MNFILHEEQDIKDKVCSACYVTEIKVFQILVRFSRE